MHELGRLDILVSGAGVHVAGPLEDMTPASIDLSLALHVRAPLLAAQAAARHLPAGGRIITIGSAVAQRVPAPALTLYATSKAALSGMTKGLARDLGDRGITVNLVVPGPTDTSMNPAGAPGADFQRMGHRARPLRHAGRHSRRRRVPGQRASTIHHRRLYRGRRRLHRVIQGPASRAGRARATSRVMPPALALPNAAFPPQRRGALGTGLIAQGTMLDSRHQRATACPRDLLARPPTRGCASPTSGRRSMSRTARASEKLTMAR